MGAAARDVLLHGGLDKVGRRDRGQHGESAGDASAVLPDNPCRHHSRPDEIERTLVPHLPDMA